MHSNTMAIKTLKTPIGAIGSQIKSKIKIETHVQTIPLNTNWFRFVRLDWKTIIVLSATNNSNNVSEQFSTCYWNNRILEVTRKQHIDILMCSWTLRDRLCACRMCIWYAKQIQTEQTHAHMDIGHFFNFIDKYSRNWYLSIACG